MSSNEPDERNLLPAAVWLLPAAMLLFALDDWPYGFYVLLRVIVCGATVLVVFHEYDLRGGTSGWMAVLAGMALLFNPLFPVGLSREQWAPIDVASAIVLVIHYLACKRLVATAVAPPQPSRRPVRLPNPRDQRLPEPRWVHLLDRDDVLVIDTATTGLHADAEVTDVAVIDTRGRVLLCDLRHEGATSYRDIHGRLMRVLERASVVCVYHSGYDLQMIKQSAERHGLDATIRADVVCIMEEYAEHYTSDGRWWRLGEAAAIEGVSVGGARHHPLTDARLTLGLMRVVVDREHAQARRGAGGVGARVDSPELTEDDIPF